MLGTLRNIKRLIHAGRVFAHYDALFPPELTNELPPLARAGREIAKIRLPWEKSRSAEGGVGARLSAAMQELGPTYIKLGQFLATRQDIIGPELADDLSQLQDELPPFPREEAIAIIEEELGRPIGEIFTEIGEPIAAASIAQVHKAVLPNGDAVAVKVLRPGIDERLAKDLDSYFFAARMAERFQPAARRLRPIDVVQTLADSVALETDLRLEAAAASELAENSAGDPSFRVPEVYWDLTARHVLTVEWIDGISARDRDALVAAGHDVKKLARQVIQTFLTHALYDGFFHADMHQGNLFIDKEGRLVAVDFGIMGRLDMATRRFLGEILYGFVMRDYKRVAQVHFDAGYVPRHKNVEVFGQALRAIGEPIMGRSADEISMARLLAQLFQVTGQFDMHTQPQLVLLQKTMVVVEGVARHLDPENNIWDCAEPVVKAWMTERLGPEGRIQDAAEGAAALGRLVGQLPEVLDQAEETAFLLSRSITKEGVRLHPDTARLIARDQGRTGRGTQAAIWIGAAALVALAATALF